MDRSIPCTLAIVFMLFSLTTAAQTPCKYVKESVDEWTKKEIRTAYLTIGNGFAGREVILQQSEGKLYIGLRITYNTDFPDVAFKKGDKITFKLASDDIIEITAGKDVPATLIRMVDVPVRMWFVNQEVKPEVFKILAASPITAIKFRLNDNEYPLPEIKERQTRKITETATCMLANQ